MRVSTVAALCLCLGLAILGCNKPESGEGTTGGSPVADANPMVGTWKLELSEKGKEEAKGKTMEAVMVFKSDNKFALDLTEGERMDSMTGKYSLDGKKLTLTPETEGGKPSSDPPETVTLSDDMKSFPTPGAAELGKMVKQ